MTGNRQGPRGRFVYESDETGIGFIYETDLDLAVAGLGPGTAAPTPYDPDNPPAGLTLCPVPKGVTLRTVFAQSSTDGARKSLIAASATADLYATSVSKSVPAIDGDSTFSTTGRKGEKLSF